MHSLFNGKFAENGVNFRKQLARFRLAKFEKNAARNEAAAYNAETFLDEHWDISRAPNAVIVNNQLTTGVLKFDEGLWRRVGFRKQEAKNETWDDVAQEKDWVREHGYVSKKL